MMPGGGLCASRQYARALNKMRILGRALEVVLANALDLAALQCNCKQQGMQCVM